VRLLLDEMISPRVARDLRDKVFDAVAVKADRPEWEALPDREILRHATAEGRTVVSNDVLDFQLLHNQMMAEGESHFGILFTDDATMPRSKASTPLWVQTLAGFLETNPDEDALGNRVTFLS
jgi:predicted nuclease of predicted toxin-antitoxin system